MVYDSVWRRLSDDATYSGSDNDAATFTLMENYQYPADHNEILNKYSQTYQCINKANLVIRDFGAADKSLFKTYNRDQMIGEAKFIRAYSYFELVKTFGAVPLYTDVQATRTVQGRRRICRHRERPE